MKTTMDVADVKLCRVTPSNLKSIPDILPERGRIEYPAELELNVAEIKRCMVYGVVEDLSGDEPVVLDETNYFLIKKEESETTTEDETPEAGDETEDEVETDIPSETEDETTEPEEEVTEEEEQTTDTETEE